MIQTLEQLLSDPKWKAFADLMESEIKTSERQALESIGLDKPNKDAFYRAKFLREALRLPENLISASKMNKNNTPLKFKINS